MVRARHEVARRNSCTSSTCIFSSRLQTTNRKTSTPVDIDNEKSIIKTKYDVGRGMRESSKQRFIIKTLFTVVRSCKFIYENMFMMMMILIRGKL